MGRAQNEYTINIADTGIFRALRKAPNPEFIAVGEAVSEAEQTLVLARDIYAELGGDPTSETPGSESPYVAPGIEAGWIEVAEPLKQDDTVQRALEIGEHVITNFSNHPKTKVAPEDAANIGLAVQYFEQNQSLHVILHTTDKALGKAAQIVVPEFGYYDIEVNYVPPQEVCNTMVASSLYTPSTVSKKQSD